jgi:hypothetical protein
MSDLELTMMRRVGELKAENARLKAEVEHLMVFCNCTLIPNKELQAQVERLTKAGDALADFLGPCWAVRKWNAAKEGKPRA